MSTPQPLHRPPGLELLLDYADGILGSATNERIRRYVEQDENTRIILEGIYAFYEKHGHEREKLETYLGGAEENIVQKLQQDSDLPGIDKKSNIRFIRITSIAASIFIVLVGGYFLFFLPENANTLVTAYLEVPYETSPVARSDKNAEWVGPYLQKNFEEAGSILATMITAGKAETEQYFFAGLCMMYQSPPDYRRAITYLENVINTNNLYQQAGRWYLCLAYYKAGEVQATRKLLEDIIQQPAHYKHEEAEKLLEAL